ncbi:uncharacterized protein [Lolium perenne]|jgi:hypothetical protein|uniref:uncharacterized protein n=1 Tax=Lolium perenne TaxID=4522 RepID=UPI0021EAAE84|nr:BON1-associated protein 2-like [Lolium perenne]
MALKGTTKFAAECSSSSSLFAKQQPPPSPLTDLEVTVLSAEEVVLGGTVRRKPLDRGAYVVVHTDTAAARTRANDEDGHCNGYPYWGEALRVTVSDRATAIDVEIYRRKSDGRAESVAATRVPVADFSVGPPGHLHCLSYRLYDSGSRMGTRNGVINIRVKRLSGAAPTKELGKGGKTVDDAASGSDGSCCGGVAKEGKVPSAAVAGVAAAPAGVVMGFPVGFNAAGQPNGKGSA